MARRRTVIRQIAGIGCLGLTLIACTPDRSNDAADDSDSMLPPNAKVMQLKSANFNANSPMPEKYTCQGEGISPDLSWDAPPAEARSLTLIVDDPDAPNGTFVHWVLYDLPPDVRQLPEAIEPKPILNQGGVQGKNDFGSYGYGAACPPNGTHRYVFKLYALDMILDLPPGATKAEVLQAMQSHILAGGELVGVYGK